MNNTLVKGENQQNWLVVIPTTHRLGICRMIAQDALLRISSISKVRQYQNVRLIKSCLPTHVRSISAPGINLLFHGKLTTFVLSCGNFLESTIPFDSFFVAAHVLLEHFRIVNFACRCRNRSPAPRC
jgi:hypothetical protein